jgi:uncharacterized protein YbjT (DUF2867 family)
MKIIVLGGAGDMASRTVRELAAEPEVTAVTVADCNLEAARRLASDLGAKVSAVGVDANDHDALLAAIRGHDAAASGIGPFYRYEARVAQAAITPGAGAGRAGYLAHVPLAAPKINTCYVAPDRWHLNRSMRKEGVWATKRRSLSPA